MFSGTPLLASDYCGPDVPQSAFSNPTFWEDQMSFRVVQNGATKVLFAEGGVGPTDGSRFEAALANAGAVDEVWLSSPGGSVTSGLQIGRALRRSGILVRVPQGRACISSCTLAFLGGALRTIDQGAYYGIHMFSLFSDAKSAGTKMREIAQGIADYRRKTGKDPSDEIYQVLFRALEQESAQSAADLARYLVEMSASLEFLTGMAGQSQSGVCYVTQQGLSRYNVVNIQ